MYRFILPSLLFVCFIFVAKGQYLTLSCPNPIITNTKDVKTQDWQNRFGSCYLVVDSLALPWSAALATCQSYGGKLVEPAGLSVTEEVGRLVESQSSLVDVIWIGYRVGKTDVDGIWSDGVATTVDVGVWGSQEPNMASGSCAYMKKTSAGWIWYIAICDTLMPFICEAHPCPTGSFRCDNGNCVGDLLVCNDEDNCGDNSDERDCVSRCRYFYSVSNGSITHPQGILHYSDSSSCQWVIESTIGSKIQIKFLSLETEAGLDFVEIWVGGRTLSTSHLIRRVSGSGLSKTGYILSSNNMAIIRFVADSNQHYSGFQLEWSSDFKCGFQLVSNRHYSDTDLKSTSISLSSVDACQLECLNRVACTAFSFHKTTRRCTILSEMPLPVSDTCCDLYFKTCPDQTSYATVASMPNLGGKLSATSSFARLSSPLYPFYYLGGLDVAWTITSPGRRIVTLEVLDVDLAVGDYVSIFDGEGPSSSLIATIDAASTASYIMSTGKVMYLYFHSSYHTQGKRGFLFKYKSGCDYVTSSSSGTITSPGYSSGSYPNIQTCTWQLSSPNNSPIRLTFSSPFALEKNDFLQVFQGTNSLGTPLHTGKGFTGSSLPQPLDSSYGQLFLSFATSAVGTNRGFNATFSTGCPLIVDSTLKIEPAAYGRYVGDEVTVSCVNNYRFTSQNLQFLSTVKLTCEIGGHWNYNPVPTCSRVFCGTPPTVSHAYLISSSGSYSGDDAMYVCDTGYSLASASATITCLSTSSWETPPSCTARRCPVLQGVAAGRYVLLKGDGREEGSVARYQCDSGYDVNGAATLVCTRGSWSQKTPSCQKRRCGLPYAPNGTITPTNLLYVGDLLTLTCKQGFQLEGRQRFQCGLDQPGQCTNIDECANGMAGCSHICMDTIGSFVCSCRDGYQLSSFDKRQCTDINECLVNKGNCDHFCTNTDGSYQCSCRPAYVLYTGQTGILVDPFISYTVDHTCVKISCPAANLKIANGYALTSKQSFSSGDHITYLCNLGYTMQGSATLKCQDGSWNGSPPTCVAARCPALVSQIGNSNMAQVSPSTSISYLNYFHLTCAVAGLGDTVTKQRCVYHRDTDSYRAASEDLSCFDVNCGAPVRLHGTLPFQYTCTTYNCNFLFQCRTPWFTKQGQSTRGDDTVRCSSDGKWDFGDLRCPGPTCSDPGTPPGGNQEDEKYTTYEEYSLVRYSCERDGFLPTYPSPLQCIWYDGRNVLDWNATRPECTDQESPFFYSCPLGVKTVAQFSAPLYSEPIPSDNSGLVKERSVNPLNFQSYSTVVTRDMQVVYRATDHENNVGSCIVNIKILDNEPPTLTCHSSSEVHIRSANDVQTINTQEFVQMASDNSGNVILTYSIKQLKLDKFSIDKLYTVFITASDEVGNTERCTVQVLVTAPKCQSWILNVENGQTSCLIYGTGYRCTVTCKLGYVFYENDKLQSLDLYCSPGGDWDRKQPVCVLQDSTAYRITTRLSYSLSSTTVTKECESSYQQELMNKMPSLVASLTSVCSDIIPHITVAKPNRQNFHSVTVSGTFRAVNADITVELPPFGLSFVTYQQCSKRIQSAFSGMTSSVSAVGSLSSVNNCPASTATTYQRTIQDGIGCYGAAEIRTATDSSQICISCPPGYVSTGSGSCVQCSVGQYRDPAVSNVCLQCPSPARSDPSIKALVSEAECFRVCPRGMFSSTGYAPCNMCPPDTYSINTTTCLACSVGTYTRGPGQTSVSACQMECVPGSFSSSGFSPCRLCPRGFYQTHSRQSVCLECMDSETTRQEGSTLSTQCVAAATFLCEPNPCKNGGQCEITGHEYQCICSSPIYTGRTCDTELDPCTSRPCYNKGSCRNNKDGTYSCFCGTTRITGDRCEKDINDCEVNPCQNNGICQDKLRSYTCHCPLFSGYTGSRCEILRSPCSIEPCSAFNSRCVESGNIRRNCICNRGFTGDNCEINIDECSPNPCMNGGTCIDQVDGVLCRCRQGYTGEMCEERNSPCTGLPCGSEATCIDNYKLETVVCQCPAGYQEVSGQCQQVNLCDSFPCQNGGQCLFMNGRYQCSCPAGYDGLRCEHDKDDCTPNPCLNNGVCVDLFNDFRCDCDPKLKQTGGKTCQDLEDQCTPYPCDFTHSKSCVDLHMDFYCNCYDGYHGKRCTLGDTDCDSFPCHHGATCIQDGSSYTCRCPAGYSGATCELENNYCTQNPCQNNAECISADNTYVCKCKVGYRGVNCETYYDLCQIAKPCIGPGSTCSFNGVFTTCKCASGYSGANCETKALSCYAGYCLNGGSCREDASNLFCTCLTGFEGDRCEININDCQTNNCPTGSTCIDGVNSFTCKCEPGKIGEQCSKDLSTDFDVVFPGALGYPPSDYLSVPQFISSTQISLSVWVKYAQQTTPGTIATLYGLSSPSSTANPQELLSLQRDHLTASFGGQQQLPYTHIAIDDGHWHNVITVWDSSFGKLSVYVDSVLVGTLSNYGIGARLPSYGWLVLGGTYNTTTQTIDQSNGLRGRISRLHITNTVLSFPQDIQQLYSDINAVPAGDIPGFNTDMVDGINGVVDYQSQLTAGTCTTSDTTCRSLSQINARPNVTSCPTDQMLVSGRVSTPRWTEPTFQGHRTITATSVSGATTMGWSTYGITYAAVDDQNNAAICSFKFFNRRSACAKPMRPMSGKQTCETIPNGQRCSVQCVGSLAMSLPGPKYYTCGTYGIYGATDRPVPFEYAACTICTAPARDVTISLNFKVTPTCSSSVQNDLRDRILSALVSLNVELNSVLCNTADCHNVNINLVCSALTTVISSTIHLPLVTEDNVHFQGEKRPARDFLVIAIVDRQIFNFPFATPERDTFEMKLQMTCVAGKQLIGDCCVECGQGTYYDSSVSSCVPCSKGTYLDEMGVVGTSTPCVTCPGSMTTATTGAQSVDKCKDNCIQGEFYNLTEGQCLSCPIGFYQSNTGSFYCDPCDITKSTAYTAQTSITSCVTDPQVTVSTSTQGPTAAASTGSSFSAEMIAIIVIVIIILIVLLVILFICCCRDWMEKMCPCLIVKVGPEHEEKWHYVDRFGETNMKFVSYKLSDYRAKKMDKQRLVESDSEKSHTNISVHLPMFEEKLKGTVSMKPVLISTVDSEKDKPRKSKSKRSKMQKKGDYQYGNTPTALPPLPNRLRADTLLYASQRSELALTYEVPVERSDGHTRRPPSAFHKKRPTIDDVPYNEFVQSASPRTTPRSRITIEDDEDLR